MDESKRTFFRQSGWMVIANTLCGVFLVGVYPLISNLPPAEVGIFSTLLRFFTVLAIPAAGLQIVMAQEAASAVTENQKRNLGVGVRWVLRTVFLLWTVIAFICVLYLPEIVAALKLTNRGSVFVAVALVLAALCLPVTQGLVQGLQNFLWLGWSYICNGFGRFSAIFFFVFLMKSDATGALTGALIGIASAVFVSLWPARKLLFRAEGTFDWRDWLRRVLPLTGGVGATLFLMNADMLLVQSHFSGQVTPFYAAPAMIGVGLVTFTTPMAAVMFPKLVRSFVQEQRSNSLILAVFGTGILGGLGALVCTIWPELPLRIMFFRNPEFLRSAPLVPWFMWSMLPITMANVLISNLLAKRRFAAVPWLVLVAVTYGIVLYRYVDQSQSNDPFTAFHGVVKILGLFSFLLFSTALVFNLFEPKQYPPEKRP